MSQSSRNIGANSPNLEFRTDLLVYKNDGFEEMMPKRHFALCHTLHFDTFCSRERLLPPQPPPLQMLPCILLSVAFVSD